MKGTNFEEIKNSMGAERKAPLFFDQHFFREFEWKGENLRIGVVSFESRKKMTDALSKMSYETIRNRFMGSKSGFTEPELDRLTVLDGVDKYALGLERSEGLQDGIGVARFARSESQSDLADVGIILVDQYQHKGLGTFLMMAIALAALEREIRYLCFNYLPQNQAIVKMVKRIGDPEFHRIGVDESQMILDLSKIDVKRIRDQLSLKLQKIDTSHS